MAQINLGTLGSPKIQDARVVQATWAPSPASDRYMSEYVTNQIKVIQLINTSAFVGTNPTGELITSGLPIRPASVASLTEVRNFPEQDC